MLYPRWVPLTFTPLVFGTNGAMGLDCQNFLRTLANKLSTKNDEPYASVISWLRIQLSFAILRTVHRCVRGSRYPFKSREVSEDFTFAVAGLLICIHNFRPRFLIVFFLVMLDFPFPTLKVFTIVSSFLSWTNI